MIFWLTAVGVFILDQMTKWLVQKNMLLGQSIPILEDIFHLTYVQNRGAAFGMLANKRAFFIIITVVVIFLIFYFYKRIPPENKFLKVGLALQVGGAVGNLVDRIAYGYVIDLFDFRIWPVFNIADSAIVVGVGLIIWELFKKDKEETASGSEKFD